jgi:hypothetical protein
MMAVLFACLVVIASGLWLARRWRARAARTRMRSGPGGSLATAIPVRSFETIDTTIAARRCVCGSRLETSGEGARQLDDRRYRMTRVVCAECEEEMVLYFDVTDVLH